MKFIKGNLDGVYLIELEHSRDHRGSFARNFCIEEFKKQGIDIQISQCSISYNKKSGTFRGMHYQIPPYQEKKIVSCVKGAIWDIVLDLRENSATYGKWESHILSDALICSIYIPEGCAHGFQSLSDDVIVHYMMSAPYSKEHSKKISYKKFNIGLTMPITAISDGDNYE